MCKVSRHKGWPDRPKLELPGGGLGRLRASCRKKRPKKTNLYSVLEDSRYEKNHKLTYLYDLGDSWYHEIELVGNTTYPSDKAECLIGEGLACAEDIGGWLGWMEIQAAFHKRDGTECTSAGEQATLRMNFKRRHDPHGLSRDRLFRWDLEAVNRKLSEGGPRIHKPSARIRTLQAQSTVPNPPGHLHQCDLP